MKTDLYDSRRDTIKHKLRVYQLLYAVAEEIKHRARIHDKSKLEIPEKDLFDKYTPLLAKCTYGSEQYDEYLKGLKDALDHHYLLNRHHPEFFENGINGMTLIDLIEMIFDWKAASERHNDGNIYKSIEYNKKRFGISDQLIQIFINIAKELNL